MELYPLQIFGFFEQMTLCICMAWHGLKVKVANTLISSFIRMITKLALHEIDQNGRMGSQLIHTKSLIFKCGDWKGVIFRVPSLRVKYRDRSLNIQIHSLIQRFIRPLNLNSSTLKISFRYHRNPHRIVIQPSGICSTQLPAVFGIANGRVSYI